MSLSPVAALAGRLVVAEVLQEPSYRRLWVSGLCVNVARWMDLVTVGWLALQLTGSPFMVGLAAFARAAPLMAVGPFAGIVADRMVRGRVLLAAQSVGLVTALALAAIFASRAGGYWPLVALEIVFGAMWALDFPARRTALYTILGASRVAQAVGPTALGALVAADGCGALLGALMIASRGGQFAQRTLFAASVLVAPVLLVALSGSRSFLACVALLVVMGAAESGFAAMQSTLVLLSAPERVRGGAMGILSACIGTQPLGTLAIGLLAASVGAPLAFAVNALAALLVIIPLAVPLARGRPG